ncbi:hypothetical protein M8C21_029508, partial [Ambrosia artemisiifolia]
MGQHGKVGVRGPGAGQKAYVAVGRVMCVMVRERWQVGGPKGAVIPVKKPWGWVVVGQWVLVPQRWGLGQYVAKDEIESVVGLGGATTSAAGGRGGGVVEDEGLWWGREDVIKYYGGKVNIMGRNRGYRTRCKGISRFLTTKLRAGCDHTLSEPLVAHENTNQLEEPSFFSKLMFFWVNPLLAKGYKKTLVLEDIPSLETIDQSAVAHEKFTKAWDSLHTEQPLKNGNMVIKTLAKVYFQEMVLSGVYVFLRTVAVLASPLLLYAFVNYTSRENKDLYEGLLLVGCLIVVKVIESLSQRHFFFMARRTGMRMRSALMVKVYEKQLKLSNVGKKRHSAGEIVNYIAVDAYRMAEFPMWFHSGWSCFIQLFLAIGVLYSIVGIGVFPGLIPLIICGLLNVPYTKGIKKCQLELMVAQDKRLKSTSEILNNIKVIKLQSWEEKFKGIIESCRELEFSWLSKVQFKKVYGTILYWMSPTLVSSVILIGSCALDKDIEAFDHGDLTEIGQRGINMSGGQKQRIQLARAVYNDADIYLLDDPFSAVDAHTASSLFNDCVMTCLQGKTVILVTHQVEFLSFVDNVMVMQDGELIQSGNYEDLLMAGTTFEQLINAHKDAITSLDTSLSK